MLLCITASLTVHLKNFFSDNLAIYDKGTIIKIDFYTLQRGTYEKDEEEGGRVTYGFDMGDTAGLSGLCPEYRKRRDTRLQGRFLCL